MRTAKSRSRTIAVCAHTGGSLSTPTTSILPAARSRFKCARALRTLFAFASAPKRCSRTHAVTLFDRSGARPRAYGHRQAQRIRESSAKAPHLPDRLPPVRSARRHDDEPIAPNWFAPATARRLAARAPHQDPRARQRCGRRHRECGRATRRSSRGSGSAASSADESSKLANSSGETPSRAASRRSVSACTSSRKTSTWLAATAPVLHPPRRLFVGARRSASKRRMIGILEAVSPSAPLLASIRCIDAEVARSPSPAKVSCQQLQ